MKYIFLLLMAVSLVFMFGCYGKIRRKPGDMQGAIGRLLLVTGAVVIAACCYLLIRNDRMALLLCGLYCAGMDWILLFMLRYIQIFTETGKKNPAWWYLLMTAAAADSISLLCNAVTHHAFQLQFTELADGQCAYVMSGYLFPFMLHIIFLLTLILVNSVALVAKIAGTTSLYKRKYMVLLWLLVAVAVLGAVSIHPSIQYDFSPLLFAVMSLATYYFSLVYIPRSVLRSVLPSIVEGMQNGIVCFDLEDKLMYINDKVLNWFSIPDEPEEIKRFFAAWTKEHPLQGEFTEWEEIKANGGDERHYRVVYRKLYGRKDDWVGNYFYIADETQKILAYREAQYKATHDDLTGIYKWERFVEKVEEAIKKENGAPRYMMCSNIMDFKLINETLGRWTGDMILQKQADMMRQSADEHSIYGRISDDKFAMCIPCDGFDEMHFDNCIKSMRKLTDASYYQIQVYFGVYKMTDPKEPVYSMCDKANLAIQHVRGDMEKHFVYYDDSMLQHVLREKNVVGEFEHALNDDQFCFFLQPQMSPKGELLGAESLVRWIHPDGSLVPPSEFIPVFERTGMIYRLDYYVWEQVVKKLSEWKKKGLDYYISVNISTRDFYYLDIYKVFTELVEKYDVEPSRLNLEITETALTSEIQKLINLIDRLKEYGFTVEIDDFGSGYSSLNMLKDIKADVLKIDMVFLRKTENEERSRTILNAIIEMALRLNMSVITEGVESEDQIGYLAKMGCKTFQGYHFSKPLPVDEFEKKYFS